MKNQPLIYLIICLIIGFGVYYLKTQKELNDRAEIEALQDLKNIAASQTPSPFPSPSLNPEQPETLNPFGASPESIYAAYIRESGKGNVQKAKLLYQMYQDEIAYQSRKEKK